MNKSFVCISWLLCSMALFAAPAFAEPSNAAAAPKDTVVRHFTAFSGDGENGWRAVVRGNRMELETIKHNEYYRSLRVRRSAYAKGVEFYGKTRYGKVVLNINSQPCRDQNGNLNEFTATLYHRGKTVQGCAVRGAYETAPT